MTASKILILTGLLALMNFSKAAPDSAGVVEMVNGLAYGGIPYGSVSGMLSDNSQNNHRPMPPYSESSIVYDPNTRAARLEQRRLGPVQILKLPSVVAPGVVGMMTQISY